MHLTEESRSGPVIHLLDSSLASGESCKSDSMVTQFMARQPILDSSGRTFGYELLYRTGSENRARVFDGNAASANVIDTALVTGLELLCGGKRAFINCTEEMLTDRCVDILPPESVVLEILETVPATNKVLESCRDLKDAGYLIALDDYVDGSDRGALLPIADIVKVEPARTVPMSMASIRKRCGPKVTMLAEKVETWEQMHACTEEGCELFQGYFFSRPQMLQVRKLRPFPETYLRMMKILAADHIQFAELAHVLKREPSLCYRLLRYLNSYRFSFGGQIRSLEHALALIGESMFRKWLSVAMLSIVGVDACSELLQTALVRARFCELMAPFVALNDEDLFLTGLLSLFNVVLNVSMEEMVEELALSKEVRCGLLGNSTTAGRCRELVTAYCDGNWSTTSAVADQLHLDETVMPQLYVSSIEWARGVSE